jgi:hypothetical protein
MRSASDDRWSRIARLMFTLLMTLTWCGAVTPAAVAQPAPPAPVDSGATPQAGTSPDKVADLNRLISAMDVASRQTPRDTFDPQAVLEQAGRDAAALFAWVRDQTSWVPYQGSLRGPRGVLMDRCGNSLDRALLLAELVRLTGVPVRLARASLPAEEAARSLGVVRTAIPAVNTARATQSLDQQAAVVGLDPTAMRQAMDTMSLTSARLAEDALRQTSTFTPALLTAIGKDSSGAAASATNDDQDRIAIADHWWVEAQLAPGGAWTAMDPLLPDAKPGQPLVAAPEKTYDPLPTGQFALPTDQLHTVEIRVVIEQWKAGKATEATVLSEILRPAEVLDQRVTLQHVPIGWKDDGALFNEKDPGARYRKTAGGIKEWLPTLNVGAGVRWRASFTTAGTVNESPSLDPAAAVGQQTGGLFGGLGAEVAGGNEGADAGVLAAEWLDYVIHVPGRPDVTIRRPVFDLRAARRGVTDAPGLTVPLKEAQQQDRGLALLGETQLLLLPCDISPEFVADLTLRALIANRDVLIAIRRGLPPQRDRAVAALNDIIRKAKPLPSPAYHLALARQQWSPVRKHVYLDRPNVLALHARMGPDAAGTTTLFTGFDVVANDVAVRRGSGLDAFQTRLAQGVADTVAESVLLSTAGGPVRGAAPALDAALARGEAPITLRSPKDLDGAAASQIPPAVRHLVSRELANGYAVVLPSARKEERADQLAWWRIDPKTGNTVGIDGPGWGAAITELAIKDKIFISVAIMAITWGLCQGKMNYFKGDKMDAGDERTCACAAVLSGFATFGALMTGNPQIAVALGAALIGGLCA